MHVVPEAQTAHVILDLVAIRFDPTIEPNDVVLACGRVRIVVSVEGKRHAARQEMRDHRADAHDVVLAIQIQKPYNAR